MDQGGNYWTLFTPRIWKVLHAVLQFRLAQSDAYKLPARPICGQHGSIALSADYQAMAQRDAEDQIEKAGIRMAFLLNKALR
jgi:hypothetical protein